MQFEKNLKGTLDEMKDLFDNFNIRLYEPVGEFKPNDINNFRIIFRVNENFIIPKFRTIKKMKNYLEEADESLN